MIALNIISSTLVYNIALKGEKILNIPLKLQYLMIKLRKYLLIPDNYYINDNHNDIHEFHDDKQQNKENIHITNKFKKRKANWLLLAAIIDRFFFIANIITNIVMIIIIFRKPI